MKWEYREVNLWGPGVTDPGQWMRVGADGWELVAVIERGPYTIGYFKRPVRNAVAT
jgi:hypothetical protein